MLSASIVPRPEIEIRYFGFMKFWVFLSLTLGILMTGCNLSAPFRMSIKERVRSRDLMQEAASAMERNEWEIAEEKLLKAVKINDKDPDLRGKYAEVLWHRGKKQEAIEQLLEAVKISPNDAKLYIQLADLCFQIEDYDSSFRCANDAIKRATEEHRHIVPQAWMILGRIYWQQGNSKKALAHYHKAISLAPKNAELVAELAKLYESMNQPDRSLLTWQKAAQFYQPNEEPSQIVTGRGNAYMAMRRYHEAVEQYTIAQQRWPNDVGGYYRLAQAHLALGNLDNAKVITEQAIAIAPSDQQLIDLKNRVHLAQHQGQPLR